MGQRVLLFRGCTTPQISGGPLPLNQATMHQHTRQPRFQAVVGRTTGAAGIQPNKPCHNLITQPPPKRNVSCISIFPIRFIRGRFTKALTWIPEARIYAENPAGILQCGTSALLCLCPPEPSIISRMDTGISQTTCTVTNK